MKIVAGIMITLLIQTMLLAESIGFEIYKIKPDRSKVLICKGNKIYKPSDFIVNSEFRDNAFYGIRKQLELQKGFTIGLLETYDHPKNGFGLWIGQISPFVGKTGFSWEWFDRVSEDRFKKRQGDNMIEVKTDMVSMRQEEITRITFMENVTMEYEAYRCDKKDGYQPTYTVIIKAGSVLQFPSVSPMDDE